MEFVTLRNGANMPLDGFDVFQVPHAAQREQAMPDAMDLGHGGIIDHGSAEAIKYLNAWKIHD